MNTTPIQAALDQVLVEMTNALNHWMTEIVSAFLGMFPFPTFPALARFIAALIDETSDLIATFYNLPLVAIVTAAIQYALTLVEDDTKVLTIRGAQIAALNTLALGGMEIAATGGPTSVPLFNRLRKLLKWIEIVKQRIRFSWAVALVEAGINLLLSLCRIIGTIAFLIVLVIFVGRLKEEVEKQALRQDSDRHRLAQEPAFHRINPRRRGTHTPG